MTTTYIPLNDGYKIPAIGLGTWQSDKGKVAAAVEHALVHSGVRHIDCAYVYGNEAEVGEGIRRAIESGKVKRADIFVTTKVFPTYHNRVEESARASLKNLGLEYVDLLLYHWPVGLNPKGNHPLIPTRPDGSRDLDPSFSFSATWEQFEHVRSLKLTRSIGVSNCSVPVLKDLLSRTSVVPAVNQIENHPLLPQLETVAFCKEKGIVVEAYSPFGSTGGPLLSNSFVTDLANKYNTSPSSILLSFHVSSGRVALPKSVTPGRIDENTKVVDLTSDDIAALENLHKTLGSVRYAKPNWGQPMGFPDY